MDEIDTYDIFNIEYNDNILDTFYKIKDYCNPMYINIHNNPSYPEFFNLIYRNVDVYNSSEIIKKMKKNETNSDIEEIEDNYHSETYEYN
jgi:hypothetical protein